MGANIGLLRVMGNFSRAGPAVMKLYFINAQLREKHFST